MREIWKQKSNIYFTGTLQMSPTLFSIFSYLFPFLSVSLIAGMYYRCGASFLVKVGESLIFCLS